MRGLKAELGLSPILKLYRPTAGDGCVLWLPGQDDPQSATIRDRSGKRNNGAISGAVWKRTPKGLWELDFDGNDDRVDCGTGASITITTEDFTLLVWTYSTVSAVKRVFGGAQNAVSLRQNVGYTWGLDKIDVATAPVANTSLANGLWSQLGIVFDSVATTNNCQYFYNGQPNGLVTFNYNFATAIRWLGCAYGVEHFWKGGIALPRIYKNIKLSAAQVANRFNQERHLFGV